MKFKLLVSAVALCIFGISERSSAQLVRTPPASSPTGEDSANCIQFTQQDPRDLLNLAGTNLWTATVVPAGNETWAAAYHRCTSAESKEFDDFVKGTKDENLMHERLMKEFVTLRHLKHWDREIVGSYGRLKAKGEVTAPEQQLLAEINQDFSRYQDAVNMQLTNHNLGQAFSGVLKLGAAFMQRGGSVAQPGTAAPSTSGNGTAATSTQGIVAHIDFESKHFGSDIRSPVEGSFGATLGFQPALAFVKPTSTVSTGTPASGQSSSTQLSANYQNAFVFNVSSNMHVSTFHAGELTLTGRVGVVNLLSDVTLVDQGANSYIAVPFASDTTRLFGEVSANVNLYRTSMDVAHLEKATLTPLFHLEGGMREDPRFEAAGAGYYLPSRRVFIRVSAENVPILQQLDNNSTSKTFLLAFVWEYEGPYWGNPGQNEVKIPSGNRLVIRGDVNLLKALKGESTK